MAWTLVAGDVFGLYEGYYPAFSVGSFTPSTIDGGAVDPFITGLAAPEIGAVETDIVLGISGDHVSFLMGKDIIVNGVAYSLRLPPMLEVSGSITATSAVYVYGAALVPDATYTIDFVAPGGGEDPEVLPPYVGTDDLANLLIGGETVAQIYIGPDET